MRILLGIIVAAAALVGAAGFALFPEDAMVQRIDFGVIRTQIEPAFDARLEPASDAPIKEYRIPMTHETIEIADGEPYEGWTFGGTVPGPALRVRQGDLVRITLVNQSPLGHSIDLHSARIPMNEAFRTIPPGGELSFEFVARDPGVFLVHCGTPPVLMHIMQGMYMTILVDPEDGWGTEADREFVIVQSEFYAREGQNGMAQPDWERALATQPTQVVFNGRAFQYKETPLKVDVGERVRFFVANAGPSLRSDFHVVGAVFDRVYPDGNPRNFLEHVQTWTIPAGGGAVFETTFEEGASGEGVYAFVTHAFADAEKGAVGVIQVGAPELAGTVGH